MKQQELVFNVIRLPVDFVMLLAAGLTTYILRTDILSAIRPVLFEFNLPLFRYLIILVPVSLVFLGAYAVAGLYSLRDRLKLTQEFLKIIVASSAGIMGVIIYIFLRQELFNSRFLVLGGWFMAILFVFVGRILVRFSQRWWIEHYGNGNYRVLIIGKNKVADSIITEFKKPQYKDHSLASHLDLDQIVQAQYLVVQGGIDEVILAAGTEASPNVQVLIDLCHEKHVTFRFIPSVYQGSMAHLDIGLFNGVPLIEVKRSALDGWSRVIKRMFDIVGSITVLVLLSPLFLIIAFAIKWESEGPVFASLKRVSGNREFNLLKFRSMISNAEELKPFLIKFNERGDGPLFKMKNDPRVTKFGRFLRGYRLDELPQFINVLRGEMSLIGPRPHQPDEIARYLNHHRRVLSIKAGATGLAQVSGSSDLPFEEEVAIDTFYIDNWSLRLDLSIFIRTALKMFFDRSAV